MLLYECVSTTQTLREFNPDDTGGKFQIPTEFESQ